MKRSARSRFIRVNPVGGNQDFKDRGQCPGILECQDNDDPELVRSKSLISQTGLLLTRTGGTRALGRAFFAFRWEPRFGRCEASGHLVEAPGLGAHSLRVGGSTRLQPGVSFNQNRASERV